MRVDQQNNQSYQSSTSTRTSASNISMENLSDECDYLEALNQLLERVNGSQNITKKDLELLHNEGQRAPRQGPRSSGEGVDENQGILAAFQDKPRELYVVTTMLVAGFVIGRGGQSMQYLSRSTQALITSFNRRYNGRKVRTFLIKGHHQALYATLKTIIAAVTHYNHLIGGKYQGMCVDKVQIIEGIPFYYEPPPKEDVPLSARTAQVHTGFQSFTASPHITPLTQYVPHAQYLHAQMQQVPNNMHSQDTCHVVQRNTYYNQYRFQGYVDTCSIEQQSQQYVPVTGASYFTYMHPQYFMP